MNQINAIRSTVVLLAGSMLIGCVGNLVNGAKEPHDAVSACLKKERENRRGVLNYSVLWEQDGHLYTTLKVASEAGYSQERAATLSYYSQYPDIDPDYEATPVAIKYLLCPHRWEWRDVVTGLLHSLHGGSAISVVERRADLTAALRESLKDARNDWLSGLLIHALGDAYAHTKGDLGSDRERAYGRRIGHAVPSLLGNSPDKICKPRNTAKYLAYLEALRETLGSSHPTTEQEVEKACRAGELTSFGPDIDWGDVKPANLSTTPVTRFMNCMNKTVRQLKKEEVLSAANRISTPRGQAPKTERVGTHEK